MTLGLKIMLQYAETHSGVLIFGVMGQVMHAPFMDNSRADLPFSEQPALARSSQIFSQVCVLLGVSRQMLTGKFTAKPADTAADKKDS